jgi:hypothetical protein
MTSEVNEIIYQPPGLDLVGIFEHIHGFFSGSSGDSLMSTIQTLWNVYSVIALLLSVVFFAGFVYAKIRYEQLCEIEQEHLRHAEEAWARRHETKSTKNARWDVIEQRVSENNPESWRVAIIEADIMLDETLTNAGYVGQSIGEKLKSANHTSFTTVQDAWEAHKVRNEIAHAGSDFILTKKTAQDTLKRFERVFKEFGVI